MQKGLFSGLFLLIMIVLLAPTVIVSDQSRNITNTYNHLTQLSLATDNVISDVLLDTTIISCSILPANGYNNVLEEYLDDLFNETNRNNINCFFYDLNTSIDGSNYEGHIKLRCMQNTKFSKISLEKELFFKKNISKYSDYLTCTVEIRDSLDGDKVYANQIRRMHP